MNLYFFQHDPLESPGYILEWAQDRGHKCSLINFYDDDLLPDIAKVEGLVIMGGPMNIYDDEEYTWLETERDFVKKFIFSGKKILGICFGSQMIADALGILVKRNQHTEIGWFKVRINQQNLSKTFAGVFPEEFITLHWHSDTFDLPENSVGFASSLATPNQAFLWNDNVVALQFHPEMTERGVTLLVEDHPEIFENNFPFIQQQHEILGTDSYFENNRKILFKLLDKFFAKSK
jgi:GMP synthase-like glutamine amidotransferase